jgi:glycerophosphoryl diester phosphodiesterase
MNLSRVILAVVFAVTTASSMAVSADQKNNKSDARFGQNIQLGPRPYFLVDAMEKSDLKEALQQCSEGPFYKSDFSIGHRGAPLQFPEHTKESYEAAARMGAGILECDVTFTKDKELVCRHSQCDLETTTNILETDLAGKCSVQPDLGSETPYKNVSCCTSDITLAEFKTLKGKMDAGNRNAKTLNQFMNATASFRTDLYSSKGTLLTHRESIRLFKKLGVKMTPELKSANVTMPFNGFSQKAYAQKLINEYKMEGVPPKNVYPQSFNLEDVRYWIANEPRFGKQAIYLETLDIPSQVPAAITKLPSLAAEGVKIVAPPTWVLVTLDANNKIVPSEYARAAKAAGLDIITWTIERSGLLKNGGGYYYQSITDGIKSDGDMMVLLDVLAQDVGIIGIFSDWPATTTYYANCMNLK